MKADNQFKLWLPVLAVAAGYFVDLYDLLLFSSIRTVSLSELNITGDYATECTKSLMNYTVLGMVIGGFFWGLLADKRGRLNMLYLSIAIYSIANIGNAFVEDIFWYKVWRFIAGFGLAGELGVGMTLISELLPRNKRTLAGLVVTSFGMGGAVAAGVLAYNFKDSTFLNLSGWRLLFIFGGVIGILLLIFRKSTEESVLFLNHQNNNKGSLKLLFGNHKRVLKYFFCFLAGLPVFFIIGNYITLSPEYGKESGISTINPALSVVWCYTGVMIFDFLGTWFSKILQSRKKVLFSFLFLQVITIAYYLYVPTSSENLFYFKTFLLGCGAGYWGVLILNSLEQFGTNLRSTVATTVPNIIRFALVPLSSLFFDPIKPYLGLVNSGAVVGFTSVLIAFLAVLFLEEKFENDLAFQEE